MLSTNVCVPALYVPALFMLAVLWNQTQKLCLVMREGHLSIGSQSLFY